MGVLSGQVALVTGASRGIGWATAVALGEAGANVAFNFFDARHDVDAGIERVQAAGAAAIAVPGDVASADDVQRMADATVAAFGKLTIGVANAAYSDRAPFYEADLAGVRRTIDVTMWGAYYLVRVAARQMIAQGVGGSLVVVGSPHAWLPLPLSMPYNMAKAATEHMARTAAIELVDQRIRVNVVHPGWTDTPGERKHFSEQTLREAGLKLPWKRLASPAEIARAVVFFCDPASDYVTGTSLLVDGGVSLPWWAKGGSGVPQ